MSSTRAVLSQPSFRRFLTSWAASSSSTMGIWIALSWVAATNGGATGVGLVAMILSLPTVLLAPLAGFLADTVPRVALFAAADLGLSCVAVVCAILAISGNLGHASGLVLAGAAGVGSAIGKPARAVYPADLVPDADRVSALAFGVSIDGIGRLLGPLLAAATTAAFGVGSVFVAAAVGFLCAALLALRGLPRRLPAPFCGQPRRSRSGTVAYLRLRPDLVTALVGLTVVSAVGWNSTTLITLASHESGRSTAEFSAFVAVYSVGGVAGSLLAAHRPVVGLAAIGRTTLLMALLMFVLATVLNNAPAFGVGLVALGYSTYQMASGTNVLFVSGVPPEMRGGVAAIYLSVSGAAVALGGAVLGRLTAEWGARGVLICSAGCITAAVGVSALVLVLNPAARRLNSD